MCLGIGSWNSIKLLIDYYDNPIITKVEEKMSRDIDFPSVTICNHIYIYCSCFSSLTLHKMYVS